MDQQPKIPTLKDAQKPQVKIKGMGAGLTLFDRLKQFKKKDLAFILAGLGTLFMAPLAEHFMMAPENGDASLQQGWGKGGTSGSFFGSGSSPYESGSHMASGGAIGGSGDIITPLNVRDPSSLVMGPGGTQQPPAGSAAPVAPPPTAPSRSDEDYKDALKGAASRAASAAVKKAPLPVPKVALGGSGLRGLGVAAGGSSASSGGSLPVGPAAGSVGGGGGSGLRLVRNTPGFKGVAGSRSPTGGTGLDNTKKAGANAGDAFNRAGSAAAGLNAAANETIPTGGQGFGGGGHGGAGANDKPGSGTGPGGSKSVGESLAFLRAKQRQEEELKLEFEKRKLKDPELLLYGIRNDILKASAGKIGEGLTSWGMCKGLGMGCPAPDDEFSCDKGGTMNTSQMSPTCSEKVQDTCWKPAAGGRMIYLDGAKNIVNSCTPTGKPKDGSGPGSTIGGAPAPGSIAVPSGANPGSVESICSGITDTSKVDGQPKGDLPAAEKCVEDQTGSTKATCVTQVASLKASLTTMSNFQAIQEVMSGSGKAGSSKCGEATAKFTPTTPAKSIKANVEAIRQQIGGADGKGGLVKEIKDALNPADPEKVAAAKSKAENVATQWIATEALLKEAEAAIKANAALVTDGFNASEVAARKGTFDSAHRDTKALSESLRKAVDNLKPAVDGMKASGAYAYEGKALGSAKLAVDTSKSYDAKIEEATNATIKSADGTADIPLMTEAEVIARPEGKSVAPAAPADGAASPTTYVDGANAAAQAADKAKTALGNLKLGGTDQEKKDAKAALLKTGDGSISQNIADSIKTQADVLDGIGAAADQSTRAVNEGTTAAR